MLMEERFKQLKQINYDEPKKVFSMYLNTDPRNPDEQAREWKIELKNALNDLKHHTKDSDSHEEKNQSKDIRQKVENEIYGKEDQLHRSVMLFGTADEDLWFSQALNIPVKTEFYWETYPELGQMQELIKQYPYTGVLVLQQDQALLIETEVGMVLDTTLYTLDMDTNQWRQQQVNKENDFTQSGTKKDKFQARVEAHQQRWFKSLSELIEKRRKEQGWEQLYLVGEQEEIEALRDYFNQTIDKIIPRNLLGKHPDNILADIHDE